MSEEIKCPKCSSTQISMNRKGFSGKKAVAGAVVTGGIGVLAGTIGSNQMINTCMKCGFQFKPQDYDKIVNQEERKREIIRKTKADKNSGVEAFAIISLILTIVTGVISYSLYSNDWKFFAFVFGFASVICLAAFILLLILSNSNTKNETQQSPDKMVKVTNKPPQHRKQNNKNRYATSFKNYNSQEREGPNDGTPDFTHKNRGENDPNF